MSTDHASQSRDWDKIISIAEQKLGVKHSAALKWRQRNRIPGKYHLPLLEAGQGIIGPSDLREPAGAAP